MPHQIFINVLFGVPEEQYDTAYAVFGAYDIQVIEEGHDQLTVCFRVEDWSEETGTQLLGQLADYGVQARIIDTERIEQRNWNEEWEQSLEPVFINDRIAITPSWHADSVHHEITVVVDPKMSFGTGYHPTTRMTTRLLEHHVRPDSSWIDAGTGTGVLAITAAKLGARHVFAFDNDEWSVENSRENIDRNGVTGSVDIHHADVFTVALPEADGIAANMYRNVLIPSYPKLRGALRTPESPLIISGILSYDEEELRLEAERAGFIHHHTEREDEWLAMVFFRGA
ncbi:MAG: 50S ribosomal protein L11 methyltransferase [Candidatus Kapaibacterium sp.]